MLDIIVRMPLHPLQITVDGRAMPEGITSVIVSNCRGFGGVFEASSHADPTDGLFDVVGMTTRSRTLWTAYLFAALQRQLHEMPGVHTARGKTISIQCDAGPIPMQRDGDPFGFTGAAISIEPGAVPVIVP